MMSSSSVAAGMVWRRLTTSPSGYGVHNVAVVEKGYIGSGNAGRNTTIIRSNYLLPGNIPLYELSMQLWERQERDLNFNTMVSQRGVLNLYHSDAQRDAYARRGNAMRLHGVDAELLNRDAVGRMAPMLDLDNARFPIHGGLLQRRGGTARHDAVVWGYARAADRRGVDIIQNCEVTGLRREGGRITGLETTRGAIGAGKIGHCSCRQYLTCCCDGWDAPADREPRVAGLRVGRLEADDAIASSRSAPATSTSASPTREASCSAATSMATTPMHNAEILRPSKR